VPNAAEAIVAAQRQVGQLAGSCLVKEPLDFTAGFFFRSTVALLNLSSEDIGIALDLIEVVVGQLAPLLSDMALQLLPLPLECVLVHTGLLVSVADPEG
jgi:hypothetical protein